MLNLLHEFKEWVVGFSDSPWAIFVLAINSFTESIFNPIPSDPLILGMAAINPGSVFWLALVATVASVAGAVVGWMGGIEVRSAVPYSGFSDWTRGTIFLVGRGFVLSW